MFLTPAKPTNGQAKKVDDYVFGCVYETYDYEKFKILSSNRDIKKSNYNGLLTSFKEIYLLALVIVNENYEIIDGQHRFNAAKELALPIRYIIMPGYGINEVRQYNKTMQKWLKLDYRDSYATEGKDAYVELTDFMNEFPDFGIQVSLKLLTGSYRKYINENGSKISSKDFQSGGLKIERAANAYVLARKILEFKEYFSGYNNPTFISAIIPILSKKIYDHKRMIQKLRSSGIHIEKRATAEQYRLLLQKIYNYKVSADQKADFFNI